MYQAASDKDAVETLTGAEFSLWTALTGGTQIPIIKVSDGMYRVAKPAEATADGFVRAVIAAGQAQVKGLENKTYYLQEEKAPDGYNKLTARVEVTPDANTEITRVVENSQGQTFPSTGGIGTRSST